MMKRRSFLKMIPWVGVALVTGGCATHKIAWEERVGVYTYDEAVLEMGPPDKEAKLEDGTRVCEWRTAKGGATGMGFGGGFWGGPYGYYPQSYSVSEFPDRYLRLIFSPEGKLTEWKKVSR